MVVAPLGPSFVVVVVAICQKLVTARVPVVLALNFAVSVVLVWFWSGGLRRWGFR